MKRSLKNILIFIVLTLIALTVNVLLMVFIFFRSTSVTPVINRIFGKNILRMVNKYLFCVEIRVSGKENIPPFSKKYASISNHLSFFDIALLMGEMGSMFIMKRSVLYIPFYGCMAYIFGSVSIKRYSLKDLHGVAEKMCRFVRLGNKIHLFPEGTRSRDGVMLEFKKGLLHKLYKENLPVLCCSIWNTHKVFPSDNYSFAKMDFSIPLYLKIGKMIEPADFNSFDDFFAACRQEVSNNLEEIKSQYSSSAA